jgi:hypothetical protein
MNMMMGIKNVPGKLQGRLSLLRHTKIGGNFDALVAVVVAGAVAGEWRKNRWPPKHSGLSNFSSWFL